MFKTDNYKNKTVVITGGTKGIGLGITKAYLSLSAKVIILARNKPKKLIQVKGNKALFYQCNVRDNANVEEVINEVFEANKCIDVLINNAGGAPLINSLDASMNFNNAIIDLNLNSSFAVSYYVAKKMIKKSSGCVITNISSVTATRPTPGSAAYGAAKGGLVNLTKTLAVEWAPRIRVNSIITGYIETENSLLHYGSKKDMKAVAKTIPMKRMGTPEDIANACIFLSSANSSWITGTAIEVHGGGESPTYLNSAKPKKS